MPPSTTTIERTRPSASGAPNAASTAASIGRRVDAGGQRPDRPVDGRERDARRLAGVGVGQGRGRRRRVARRSLAGGDGRRRDRRRRDRRLRRRRRGGRRAGRVGADDRADRCASGASGPVGGAGRARRRTGRPSRRRGAPRRRDRAPRARRWRIGGDPRTGPLATGAAGAYVLRRGARTSRSPRRASSAAPSRSAATTVELGAGQLQGDLQARAARERQLARRSAWTRGRARSGPGPGRRWRTTRPARRTWPGPARRSRRARPGSRCRRHIARRRPCGSRCTARTTGRGRRGRHRSARRGGWRQSRRPRTPGRIGSNRRRSMRPSCRSHARWGTTGGARPRRRVHSPLRRPPVLPADRGRQEPGGWRPTRHPPDGDRSVTPLGQDLDNDDH